MVAVPAAAVTLDGAAGASAEVYSRPSVVGCSIDREATSFATDGYIVGCYLKHMVACVCCHNCCCSIATLRFDGQAFGYIYILSINAGTMSSTAATNNDSIASAGSIDCCLNSCESVLPGRTIIWRCTICRYIQSSGICNDGKNK